MNKKQKNADILAVAREAKVSPSTVSRFFNHPELLKRATRLKIDEAVKHTGYIRNRAAQTIHGIRSATIGLIVPTIDHAIFAELVQAFSDAVSQSGFTILLATHGYDLDLEYAVVRKMLEHRVDGLALVGLEHAAETFLLIDRQQTPSILLWSHAADAPLPCVGADNFEAGFTIGQHIVNLGHRDVGALFPPLVGNDRADQRYAGVLAALSQCGLQIPEPWALQTPYSVTEAKQTVEQLLASETRPSALVCGNDVLAWGALHAASRQGVKIPTQLSVTGIGDFKGSRDFEPALTTVRIPARQIGRKGGEALSLAITEAVPLSVSECVRPELIARATSAAPEGR